NTQANKDLAREVAQQSIILLKNENDLLPLSKELKSIAVIGPNADMMYNQLGDYTSPQPDEAIVTVLEGIKNKLPKTKVNYVKGCAIRDTLHTEIATAVEAAKQSDVAVVVLGGSSARDFEVEFKETGAAIANANSKRLADMESGEGFDRVSLTLMGKQNELLEAVRATGKPVVVVMIQGRPLDISKAAETVPAILNAWYPGSEGGNAIADVLFGDYNPAGRLPISIPKTVGQLPVYYSSKEKSRHDYIESTAQPLYPFGYGLSYTNFTYGTPRVVVNETPDNVSVDVFVTVTNSGKKAGDEVVQLYLQDKKASVVLPYMQLKNFARVSLQPGESKEVKLTLGNDDLRLLNRDYKWVVEAGEFEAMIGAASNDIRQTATFNVKNNYQLSK
ncbi:MAG: glycoside hydrolase family 3 C-terminal domain-containing protein, partial [Tannerellaceae bacterium]